MSELSDDKRHSCMMLHVADDVLLRQLTALLMTCYFKLVPMNPACDFHDVVHRLSTIITDLIWSITFLFFSFHELRPLPRFDLRLILQLWIFRHPIGFLSQCIPIQGPLPTYSNTTPNHMPRTMFKAMTPLFERCKTVRYCDEMGV
jgi:hypothetical protein